MNILVYPHDMAMGGSQINALELAAAVRDKGHNVLVMAPEGVLAPMIGKLGLEHIPTPVNSYYPSPRTMLRLAHAVRRHRIDLVHAYEWRPVIEAAFGPHVVDGTPVLMTVLSMSIPGFLPTHLPMIVGTRELRETARTREDVHVLEPPIDTEKNRSSDVGRARARWGFDSREIVVSVICRLSTDLDKLQGVLAAIETVDRLAMQNPVRLLVVGDGDGLRQVEEAARRVNDRHVRPPVIVAGSMLDPRDAYDAADIVLGMGSSALKGMAFSKPLVVQGEAGFWKLLDETTIDLFMDQGWFGHGGDGSADLERILRKLIAEPDRRAELGRLGRDLVVEHFSLNNAADRLIEIYGRTMAKRTSLMPRLPSLLRSAARVSKFRTYMARRALIQRFRRQEIAG